MSLLLEHFPFLLHHRYLRSQLLDSLHAQYSPNEEVKSAIFQCINFKENGVNEKIAENIGKEVAK